MASSSSSSGPGSSSKKPLDKMADWFRKSLSKKPKKMPSSPKSTPRKQPTSEDGTTVQDLRSAATSTPEASSSPSISRWSRDYDICVCHSEEDFSAAQELVSYLENGPGSLRCFLQLRDATPGSAVVSELCQALSGSHCRVLLITPSFLLDPWCKYQMLQALSQAPSSEGRTIPLLAGISPNACPAELRFMYFVDGRGPDKGFRQVREAVLRCKWLGKGRGAGATPGNP